MDDKLISNSPQFFGANPADAEVSVKQEVCERNKVVIVRIVS